MPYQAASLNLASEVGALVSASGLPPEGGYTVNTAFQLPDTYVLGQRSLPVFEQGRVFSFPMESMYSVFIEQWA